MFKIQPSVQNKYDNSLPNKLSPCFSKKMFRASCLLLFTTIYHKVRKVYCFISIWLHIVWTNLYYCSKWKWYMHIFCETNCTININGNGWNRILALHFWAYDRQCRCTTEFILEHQIPRAFCIPPSFILHFNYHCCIRNFTFSLSELSVVSWTNVSRKSWSSIFTQYWSLCFLRKLFGHDTLKMWSFWYMYWMVNFNFTRHTVWRLIELSIK